MLIQGATILAMGGVCSSRPFTGDLLIGGHVIAGIGPDLTSQGMPRSSVAAACS